MKTIETITAWDDANEALAQPASHHREVADHRRQRDEAMQTAKDLCVKGCQPLEETIEDLEAELKRYTLAHQDELEGRSRTLAHGRVGLFLVKRLAIGSRRVKGAIDWLVNARKLDYLHTKYALNKDALQKAPATVLRAIGARVAERDQFFYEVDNERYAVEED